ALLALRIGVRGGARRGRLAVRVLLPVLRRRRPRLPVGVRGRTRRGLRVGVMRGGLLRPWVLRGLPRGAVVAAVVPVGVPGAVIAGGAHGPHDTWSRRGGAPRSPGGAGRAGLSACASPGSVPR